MSAAAHTTTAQNQASSLGLTAVEIDRMASAFEHQDLYLAHKKSPKRKT
jgi:hypothetical protein